MNKLFENSSFTQDLDRSIRFLMVNLYASHKEARPVAVIADAVYLILSHVQWWTDVAESVPCQHRDCCPSALH